jgi:hypothetical protein
MTWKKDARQFDAAVRDKPFLAPEVDLQPILRWLSLLIVRGMERPDFVNKLAIGSRHCADRVPQQD